MFVDESGVTTAMTRRYARAPRGRRALATAPCGHWRRLTLLGALGCEGMVAAMSVEAATSTAVFLASLDRVLIPELVRTKPGAVVVMDNLRPHRRDLVRPQVVQDHHRVRLARAPLRDQRGVEQGGEHRRGGRALDAHDAGGGQGTEHRQPPPAAPGAGAVP